MDGWNACENNLKESNAVKPSTEIFDDERGGLESRRFLRLSLDSVDGWTRRWEARDKQARGHWQPWVSECV